MMDTFNENAMLDFVRSCLFQRESPVHQEFSKIFPSLNHDGYHQQ